MSSPNSETRRIHFYGVHDYETFPQIPEVYEAVRVLGDEPKVRSINDIVELWHLMQFIEVDLLPSDLTEVDREIAHNKVPLLDKIVGRYFSQLHNEGVIEAISAIDYLYREDLLVLFNKYHVYQRCGAEDVIPALLKRDFSIVSILDCEELVRLYDESVRTLLMESPIAAELIVEKYLEKRENDVSSGKHKKDVIYLPKSLTAEDKHQIIGKYIREEFANPNILKLIVNAGASKGVGIDDHTKLDAKRAYESFWNKHFETHEGLTFDCKVLLADDQGEESIVIESEHEIAYSYSKEWLTKYTDNSTILNNLIYVFDYSNMHMLLNFPSFESEMGVIEKVMGIKGNKDYQTGIRFGQKEAVSVLQMQMYTQLLRSIDIRLEDVIAWFFNTHISTEYHAENFQFKPSSSAATFLERDRHLFSEMESLLHQYALFVKFGKIDRDLLSVSSAPIVYQQLPSLSEQKYVYVSENPSIQKIQKLLFSDQSALGYIDKDLHESTFVKLILNHDVCIEQLKSYQIPEVNYLRNQGILSDQPGKPLRFNNVLQIVILYEIHSFGVASFLHYPEEGRVLIEEMENSGWLNFESTLLTREESSYFDFMLNQHTFNNGLDLRNKYLHGSQIDGEDNSTHFTTYLRILKMLIGLTIKINDDFQLLQNESDTEKKTD